MKPPAVRWATLASLAAAGCAAAATKIHSNDLWWHLETGKWILAERAIPRADVFSFTSQGTPWMDHGWLWQVAAWLLFAGAGAAGLFVLKAACAVTVVTASCLALRNAGWGLHSACAAATLALAGTRFRILDRPETAGLACLALFLLAASAPRLSRAARLAAIFALCALWANLHASVLVAPLFAGLAAAGSWLGARRAQGAGHPDARRLHSATAGHLVMATIAAAALLVNPYGAKLARVPAALGGILSNPALVNPEWLPPDPRTFPFLYAALVATLGFCTLRILRGEPGAWRGLLLASIASFLALKSARHIGIFFVAAPFALAACGNPARHAGVGAGTRRLLWSLVPASWAPAWGLAAALLFPLTAWPPLAPAGFGVEPGRFPAEEASWIEARLPERRRTYNDVADGGYLIWRFFPASLVFIDGRNEVHAALLEELGRSLDDGRAWAALLERYGVDSAVVGYRSERIEVAGSPAEEARSFTALHFPKRIWALVHWGDAAMVFVKRGGAHDDLIAEAEYEFLNPEDWEYLVDRCRRGEAVLAAGIRADLDRRLGESPPSARAEELAARFRGTEAE